MYLTRTIAVLLALVYAHASQSAEQILQSGPARASLIELYTSEGCSSCPPSERHLNSYLSHPDLWARYVPLAFHVDYWDYIGWRDRFARPAHGQRQNAYARLLRARTVYTPAFFVNGKSWRPGLLAGSAPYSKNKTAGNLRLRIDGLDVSADFAEPGGAEDIYLNLALLGLGLSSKIERGENAGSRAAHEFVVVGFTRADPAGQETAGNTAGAPHHNWRTRLPVRYPGIDKSEIQRYALAAWVSKNGDPTPLQAVGGFIDYKAEP